MTHLFTARSDQLNSSQSVFSTVSIYFKHRDTGCIPLGNTDMYFRVTVIYIKIPQ